MDEYELNRLRTELEILNLRINIEKAKVELNNLQPLNKPAKSIADPYGPNTASSGILKSYHESVEKYKNG